MTAQAAEKPPAAEPSPSPQKKSLRRWITSEATKKRVAAAVGVITFVGTVFGIVVGIQSEFGGSSGQPQSSLVTPAYCQRQPTVPSVLKQPIYITLMEELPHQAHCWTPISAPISEGSRLEFLVTYRNPSHQTQNKVVVGMNMAPKMTVVPGTTKLFDPDNPNGVLYNSDNIPSGGIGIGNYGPGAGAYVTFEVQVPPANQISCGINDFRNVAVVSAKSVDDFDNTNDLQVLRDCSLPAQPA